jgi:hypothetical protein
MADLIIKPSVGTDNKLIIQNQAGNDVLTTDNSGVTLTNANLANANNVYPLGHVIQTKITTDAEDLDTTSNVASSATLSLSCTSGNILVAQMVGGYTYSAYASSYVTTGIRLNYDSTDYDKFTARYSSNNDIKGWMGCAFITHAITYTGTHTIKRLLKKVDGTGTARWYTDGDTSTVYWLIQEIKPTA